MTASEYWSQWDKEELDDMRGVEKFTADDNFMIDRDEVIIDERDMPFYQDICSDRDFL